MTIGTPTAISVEEWRTANATYLAAEMARLRLLLRRRVLWLRRNWQRETKPDSIGWAISDDEADLLLVENDGREELSFYQSDPEALRLGHALHDAECRISTEREELQMAGMPAALDILASRFDLTPFERDVVLLCLAPELDSSFERLYGYLQDDASRKFVTPQLALDVLANGQFSGTERSSFLSEAPLRRWRLITLGPSAFTAAWIASPMRLSERVADYLLGTDQIDERCRRLIRPVSTTAVPDCQHDLAGRLAQWLSSGTRQSKLLLNLAGRPDSGRLALAQAACREASIDLIVLSPHALAAGGSERSELLVLLEREAMLEDTAFYLDLEELKRDESQVLLKELETFAAPLIIASRERLTCDREILAVSVGRPGAVSQGQLWQQTLGRASISNSAIESIVEQFDLGPGGIARAAAHARNQAVLREAAGEGLSVEDLWAACRQQTDPQLEQWARKVELCYDWDDIVVPREVLRQLQEIAAQVSHRHAVYEGWGFGKKLSRGRGISALFSGASGVGKTMAAEVMARDLKLDLYRIDLAGVVSKYIGETEKNLRGIFDAAERSGAILFFDEADALFGKRSEVKDSHDRYANIEVNYLLQRMEDYRGLAILATNMKSALDSAFMRRLRFIVDFTFPDAAQRREIWRKVFPPQAAVVGVDYGLLSRLEIAGGNIRNIAVNAAFLAAGENQPIGMDHVMRAARREYTKIDRLIMDGEFGRFAKVEASS